MIVESSLYDKTHTLELDSQLSGKFIHSFIFQFTFLSNMTRLTGLEYKPKQGSTSPQNMCLL